MTIQELNKLYNDACLKIVDIKFTHYELRELISQMFNELYTRIHQEDVKNHVNPCEHKNTFAVGETMACGDCGKIL